jgi:hypothetical protein
MPILNIESLPVESFNRLAHEKSFEALENNRHEQHCHDCEHGQISSSRRHSYHNIRLIQLLLTPMLAGVVLLAWHSVNRYDWGASSDNLERRAVGVSSSGQ